MFQYNITESEVASNAVEEISSRLLPLVPQQQEEESQLPNQNNSSIQLVSMKESFDLELLTRFYNELMIPNFPLEEERDDLEDWLYCLDPDKGQNSPPEEQPYPSMDVLLLVKHENKHSNLSNKEEVSTTTIVAGVAFEYYKQAQCGLLSYMVVSKDFRRLGIMTSLHPVACHAMQLLHQEHATTIHAKTETTIRAILAETNTPEAGDVPPAVIRKRHETLYKLGYRHLKFPYIQPALGEDANSFDEIILLIYAPDSGSSTTTIETEILKDYIVDFFQSVTGYDNKSYQQDWYYQLVDWFWRENALTDIAQDLPWEDVTDTMKERMTKSANKQAPTQRKENHVVVVGAGIAGLVSTVTLAEEYLSKQNSSDGDLATPLRITLIEAQPFVGGRIRTVVTRETENEMPHPFVFSNDQLPDSQKVHGFHPWPVPIGAEFVHGVDSMANELIEDHEEWLVHETFDLCESTEEYPARNSFVQRRSSITLSEEQRRIPHVEVFMNGMFCPMQEAGDESKTESSSETSSIRQSIKRASHVWQELQDISEELSHSGNGVKHGKDKSLDEFVEDQLSNGGEELTGEEVEDVKRLLECVYSNTAGSSNQFLGVHEASREEWNWEYTESNFRLDQCFNEFIQYYLDRITQINQQSTSSNLGVKIDIELGSPVSEIGSTSNGQTKCEDSPPIRVLTRNERVFCCDKCIVTVPLGVLKAKKLTFSDAYKIPLEMQEAIDTINMFSGMKAHMLLKVGSDIQRISKRMKNTELLFCPGEIFSQIWLRRNEESVFLSGFCVANCRDKLMQITASRGEESKSKTAQDLMLDQVQRIFESSNADEDKIFSNPSSPSCSSFALHDWSEDEFTLGIYSSPSVGAGWGGKSHDESVTGDVLPATYRDRLAKPIMNEIWFSGEHANTATCATVQSAMESGARAAKEVCNALDSA